MSIGSIHALDGISMAECIIERKVKQNSSPTRNRPALSISEACAESFLVAVAEEELLALLGPALVVGLGRYGAVVVDDGRSRLLGLIPGSLGLLPLEHVAGTAATDVLCAVARPAGYSARVV